MKKTVCAISIFCVLAWEQAIIGGDTVSLIVSPSNASVEGKWDSPSGQDAEMRYINVSAGADVELGGDGGVGVSEGADVSITTNDSSSCIAECELDPQVPQHRVQISGTYTTDGDGSETPTWSATGYTESLEVTIIGELSARHNEQKVYKAKVFYGGQDVTNKSSISWELGSYGFKNGGLGETDTMNLGTSANKTIKFEIPYDNKPITGSLQQWNAFPQWIIVTATYNNIKGNASHIVSVAKGTYASATPIKAPIENPQINFGGSIIAAQEAIVEHGPNGTEFSGEISYSYQTSLTVSVTVTAGAEAKVGWSFIAEGKASVSASVGGSYSKSDTITNSLSWSQKQDTTHDVRIFIEMKEKTVNQEYALREYWHYDSGLCLLWDIGSATENINTFIGYLKSEIIN